MPSKNHDIALDRYTQGIIRCKAKQLIGLAGFTEQDVPSIEQTLMVHVLQRLKSFDAAVGHRKSFVTAVVERYVASLLRDARAQKRGPSSIQSLNMQVVVPGEGPTELGGMIDEENAGRRRGVYRRSSEELYQMAEDMASVIATLPAPWQQMLKLRREHDMGQVAEIMGIARSTLNDWMSKVAERFEEAGLREYLA